MRHRFVPALILAIALLTAACGSVEEPALSGASETASAPEATGCERAEDTAVTLTDATGEELTLDAPAAEVVGLEWGVVENLVSLGVMPIGVADVEGYSAWVSAAPLDAGVTDVGTRGEPSIDALVALEPDLVIATNDLGDSVIEQIAAAVPVLVVRGADAEDPIGQMRENLELIAQAVGREQEAAALLDELDTSLEEGAVAIGEAGAAGGQFVMADGYLEGSAISIRMFTDGSLVGAVGEELGLDNAWTGEGDPDYGLAQTDVEGLTALGDLDFLYYANDVEGDPFAEGLAGNAIWEGLPFVAGGNVHRLPDGIWMFGGPRSVEQWIEATVEAVTS